MFEPSVNIIIPTTGDIGAMIESVKKSADAVGKITGSITKMADSVKDISGLKKAATTANTIIGTINSFTSSLVDIIKAFNESFPADKLEEINRLYIDANEYEMKDGKRVKDKDGKDIIKTSHRTIPVIISQLASTLGSINKSIESLGKGKLDIMGIALTEIKIEQLGKNLKLLVDKMKVIFGDIAQSDDFKQILELLVSDPEETETNLTTNQEQEVIKDSKNYSNLIQETNTKVKKGKMGLLDAILSMLNIMSGLNSLKAPNFITFRLNLWLSMRALKMTLNGIVELAKTFKNDIADISGFGKSISDLGEALAILPELFNTVEKIGSPKFIIKAYIARWSFNLLTKLLLSMQEFFSNEEFKKFLDKKKQDELGDSIKSVKTNLKDLISLTDSFKSILSNFVLCGALALLAIPSIILVIQFFVLFKKALNFINWLFNGKKYDELIESLDNAKDAIFKISLSILMLTGAVLLLALAGLLIQEEWKNFGIVALFFVLVSGIFILIGLVVQFMKELNTAKQLLYIAGTVMILASTVILLSLASQLIQEEWKNFGIVALFLLGLVVAFMIIGKATKFIEDGSKNMLFIALAVGILVVIMYILVPVSYLVNDNWDNIGQTLLILGALVLAVIGVAFASKFIKKGVASMVMIAIAMIVMSASLLIIAKAAETITWKSFIIFSLIVGGLTYIAINLGNPAVALIAVTGAGVLIAIGAAFLIFAISLKTTIDAIKTVKEMNLDPKKDSNLIKQPIEIICKAIEYASTISIKTVMSGVAKIMLIGEASSAISNMGDTVQKFAELKMPTKFDKNGKPIAFKPMSKADFENAATNIKTIITFILEAISSKEITETLESLSEQAIENIGLIMDNTAGVVNLIDAIEKAVQLDDTKITNGVASVKSAISQYIIALQELFIGTGNIKKGLLGGYHLEITGAPELDEDQLDEIIDNLENVSAIVDFTVPIIEHINEMADKSKDSNPSVISDIISKYINAIYGDENGKGGIKIGGNVPKQNGQLSFIISQQERLAKINTGAIQKNTDNFIRFIDKANSVDVEKIKSIRDMFEQISEFSKSVRGDFDKLADVLSEKLVVILEKLHGTLEGISTSETGKEFDATGTTAIEEKRTPAEANKAKDDKQKQQEKNIKDIKDALDEITLVLKGVRDNTDNYYRGGFGGF